jgi:Luciferase
MRHASERIEVEVGGWEGVTVHPHRFGGVELRLGRRELGHLHGDTLADLPFRRRIRDMLVETGRAEPHRILPDSGWVSKPIRSEEDVEASIELFRLGYERARVAAAARIGRERSREASTMASPEVPASPFSPNA